MLEDRFVPLEFFLQCGSRLLDAASGNDLISI
jgi:hypothetical protein